MNRPLLIAGIGNIFFGDDAFGSEVARKLKRRIWPDGIQVEDYGIRSYDLAYALMDGCDAILIDTASRGDAPGTLYLLELETEFPDGEGNENFDAHGMNPVQVLRMVRSLGGKLGRLYLVACEPSKLDSGEEMGLSAPVEAAIPAAADMVAELADDLLNDRRPATTGTPRQEVI